ncbi:MAG: phage portal protein [Aeriscardovia sp.]|nr:phage portal protein [Aeriscardovia sp.]
MEITVFNHTLRVGLSKQSKGNTARQTSTTIVTLPNYTPKESIVKMNERTLREFSRTAIPHRAISLIRDGVLAQNWRIAPVKPGDSRSYKTMISAVENVIKHPNESDDYRSFWGQVISETLIGDNGAAEIVFTGDSRRPMKLYPVNGFALEYVKGFFTDPNFYRFVQVTEGCKRAYLYDRDVLYLQHSKTADSPYGMSPLEAAFKEVRSLQAAQNYASNQADNATPKMGINLGENAQAPDVEAFRKYWREEIAGTGETPIFGGSKGAGSVKLGAGSDDEMFLAWQGHLITAIALAFGIDPKKLGQGSNTDRSTVEEQNESMLNEAIRPICLLIQDAINEKIIKRLGLADMVKFEFYYEDTHDQKMKAQQLIVDQWNTNALTYKEYREKLGLPALDSEYNDMTQAEMKSALNKKYAIQTGGFNGLGKDQKEGVDKKTNGEKGTKS